MSSVENNKAEYKEKFGSSFVASSGSKGGVPMFSRIGKQTIAEALCFQEPDATVLSTSMKEKIMQNQLAAEAEEEDEQYDIADLHVQDSMAEMEAKKGLKSKKKALLDATKVASPRKPPAQKSQLQTVFENLQAEIQQKQTKSKTRFKQNSMDYQKEDNSDPIYKQNWSFKSNIQKGGDACYKIIDRPVSLNEGNYRVNFEPVDANVAVPTLVPGPKHEPRSRMYRVAPCVLNKTECTYASRKKAKQENSQNFNSALQLGEGYFINRNLDNRHRLIKKLEKLTEKESKGYYKRFNMPEDKQVSDYEDQEQPSPAHKGDSPKAGAASPRQEQSRTNSKEASKRVSIKKQKTRGEDPTTPQTADYSPARRRVSKKRHDNSFFSEKNMVESMNTPMKNALKAFTPGSLRHANTANKKQEPPRDTNSMFGSYTGTYAKIYKPGFDGTFRHRTKQAANAFMGHTVTREAHNQQGSDPSYGYVQKKITSPVPLHLTRPREIFHRRDGAMLIQAHENRFLKINDTTVVNSKFRKYQSPAFENWAEHSLDEFIQNPSNCRNENVNHIFHDAKHDLVQKDLTAGLPDFDRYISREENLEKTAILGMKAAPNPYDQNKVKSGHHQSKPQDKNVVPFKLLSGRDNLYQKMNGLPKHSKEEMDAHERRYHASVDYREFLPNSLLSSPKRSSFSNSFKTRQLGLSRTNTGQGKTQRTRNGLGDHSQRVTTAASPQNSDWKFDLSMAEYEPTINKNKINGRLESKLLVEKAKRKLEKSILNKSAEFKSGGFNSYIEKRVPL